MVFEPNDMDLWQRVKRTLNAFLTRTWRDGALFGATPQEAFYVKCDSETNPPEVVDAGQLVVEIGSPPSSPPNSWCSASRNSPAARRSANRRD